MELSNSFLKIGFLDFLLAFRFIDKKLFKRSLNQPIISKDLFISIVCTQVYVIVMDLPRVEHTSSEMKTHHTPIYHEENIKIILSLPQMLIFLFLSILSLQPNVK